MTKKRFLTKSIHKMAMKCPAKISYVGKPEYQRGSQSDSGSEKLAIDASQVRAMARIMFSGGTQIAEKDIDQAVAKTAELISKSATIVIYDGIVRCEKLLTRVGILKKEGKILHLYDVRSGSYDSGTFRDEIYDKRPPKDRKKIKADYKSYLYELAYLTMVCRQAFPDLQTKSYLVMINKKAEITVDKLNQKFSLTRDPNDTAKYICTPLPGLTMKDLGVIPLGIENVDTEVDLILNDRDCGRDQDSRWEKLSFVDEAKRWAELCYSGKRIDVAISGECKHCEFRAPLSVTAGNGFVECCTNSVNKMKISDIKKPLVFDIWDLNHQKLKTLISQKRLSFDLVNREDLLVDGGQREGAGFARQWSQIQKELNHDLEPHYEKPDELVRQLMDCQFPLHFIDFETCMTPIPFHKGRKPNETIAFQFSHHEIQQRSRDIVIKHKDEYINTEPGIFPNFDFVRALKKSLSGDKGTIFTYTDFEKRTLNALKDQLAASKEKDRDALIKFIEGITEGGRLVDLALLVKNHYYHPMMSSSNGLKAVLPAILNDSPYLQTRYSAPIYGSAEGGVVSKNFRDHIWIKRDPQKGIIDPYSLLAKLSDDTENIGSDSSAAGDEVHEGSGAMLAYLILQSAEIDQNKREGLKKALLRYCELDTFAMVLLFEYWWDKLNLGKEGGKAA